MLGAILGAAEDRLGLQAARAKTGNGQAVPVVAVNGSRTSSAAECHKS